MATMTMDKRARNMDCFILINFPSSILTRVVVKATAMMDMAPNIKNPMDPPYIMVLKRDWLAPGSMNPAIMPVMKLMIMMMNTEIWVTGRVTMYLVRPIIVSIADILFPKF